MPGAVVIPRIPVSVDNQKEMSQFYKIDSTRVTLREYWWGMPAFTQWLCNQNCAGIRYEFLGGYGGSFDETEEDLADLQ